MANVQFKGESFSVYSIKSVLTYAPKKGDPLHLIFLLAASLSALYSTLDPTSVSQHFAFYELYPKTPEGRRPFCMPGSY